MPASSEFPLHLDRNEGDLRLAEDFASYRTRPQERRESCPEGGYDRACVGQTIFCWNSSRELTGSRVLTDEMR